MESLKTRNVFFLILAFEFLLSSCSVSKQISKAANETILSNKALINAHVGISVFDPVTNKYWYNFQGDKYFVPASNTKIPTCYAAMKYLGDSLVAAKYRETGDSVIVYPNGDPTFFLKEFSYQPLLNFLERKNKQVCIETGYWKEEKLGSGWAWNDYEEYYMAERSVMPVHGNVVEISGTPSKLSMVPSGAAEHVIFDSPAANSYVQEVHRTLTGNTFSIITGGKSAKTVTITYDTKSLPVVLNYIFQIPFKTISNRQLLFNKLNYPVIKSQPLDSLLKPMMHRSDNFFAEQSLLMVSNTRLGYMNDSKIIDTLLMTDLKDLPQKPRWADGSGLSRYNLFTPQDFVAILNKMKNEFGMDRLRVIMATGGEGTISSYYKADSGYIYGKTGTLSGVVAFSGFMYTKKGKLLIFSTLVNNHQASATDVRKAVEKFLQGIRAKY